MSNTNENIKSTEKKWELRSEKTVEDSDIKDIAEALAKNYGINIDKKKIVMIFFFLIDKTSIIS